MHESITAYIALWENSYIGIFITVTIFFGAKVWIFYIWCSAIIHHLFQCILLLDIYFIFKIHIVYLVFFFSKL